MNDAVCRLAYKKAVVLLELHCRLLNSLENIVRARKRKAELDLTRALAIGRGLC